jgi:predicted TIM-barrel fold metal-dependent hydrolase
MRNAMARLRTERVLFATDHPFESINGASDWLDACAVGENDREAIGVRNARRLFRLDG